MVSDTLLQRMNGIQKMLIAAYDAGALMSSATKGTERETFIETFLKQVFTPQYRFGSGDAFDQDGNQSGQLDVVIEYPLVPSLPIVGNEQPRLYLAEGIAAVVEVKSNVSSQWAEVIRTATKLAKLKRKYSGGVSLGKTPGQRVPFFAVGFTGWKSPDIIRQHLDDAPIDGVLVIDSGCFVSTETFNSLTCGGSSIALWCLISCIHRATSIVTSTATGVPIKYVI